MKKHFLSLLLTTVFFALNGAAQTTLVGSTWLFKEAKGEAITFNLTFETAGKATWKQTNGPNTGVFTWSGTPDNLNVEGPFGSGSTLKMTGNIATGKLNYSSPWSSGGKSGTQTGDYNATSDTWKASAPAPPAPAIPTSGKTFNGTSDVVSLNTSITTGLSSGSAVTIDYWFKGSNIQSAVRLQFGTSGYIIAGANGATPMHIISTDGGTNGLRINKANGVNVNDNQWHHIAMTWEKGKIGGFKSYVDGVIVDSRNAGNVNLPDLTGVTPVLGAYVSNDGKNTFTNGQLARIRIWKVARTEAQIIESRGKATDYSATENGLLYQGTPQ
jgi:hypothetical protein